MLHVNVYMLYSNSAWKDFLFWHMNCDVLR